MVSQVIGKFRGCLAGSLIGDCFGAPFEDDFPVSKTVLSNFFKKNTTKVTDKGHFQMLPYTDDSAMTRSVAASLIEKKGYDAEDMAKKFTMEYFHQPRRGYGANVGHVFHTLRSENFADVYQPAKAQFQGTGSYGNGGAMRISPVALFCHNSDLHELISIAKQSTMLTHSHHNGFNGAIMQCLAVHQALKATSTEDFDTDSFLNSLKRHMETLEQNFPAADQNLLRTTSLNYCDTLTLVREALAEEDITPEEVAKLLGNEISAMRSVPTAIYAFLRGHQPLHDGIETDNPFVRTLYLSIAFGGDTDTIASMACSIAGAFYGIDSIPEAMRERCEDMEFTLSLADNLSQVAGVNAQNASRGS